MKALRFSGPGSSAPLSRDKQDTLLLIASALLVLMPHASHLPIWVSLLCGATLAWRATLTLLGCALNARRSGAGGGALHGVLRNRINVVIGRWWVRRGSNPGPPD